MYLKKKKKVSEEELDENEFFKYIGNKSKGINYDLFKDYFYHMTPTFLAKELFGTKDGKKNNDLANVINSGLYDLEDKIEKMSQDEKKLKNQIKY